MSEMNRRDFGVAAAMFAAMGAVAEGQAAATAGTGVLAASKAFAPGFVKAANGSERWTIGDGALATGEAIGVHVSIVPAGTPKVDLHVIKHSELIAVAEGSMTYEHDGIVEEVKPGSVIYVAYGTNHRVWNSGTTAARYFVMQIGGDTKKG